MRVGKKIFVAAGVVLVAAAALAGSYALMTTTSVTLINQSGHQIGNGELVIGRQITTVGTVAPGQSLTVYPQFSGESSITLRFNLGSETCRWTGGYVEGSGYQTTIEINGCNAVHNTR